MENGMTNAEVNGHLEHDEPEPEPGFKRFSAIPSQLEIPVQGEAGENVVEVDLEELEADPTELCALLENEDVANRFWITASLAYAREKNIDTAIEVIRKALQAGSRSPVDKLPLYNCLVWFYLAKCRDAPRTQLEAKPDQDIPTKDHYLRMATTALNDATRSAAPSGPLQLARGVVSLLRAALISEQQEKTDALRAALRAFEDCARSTKGSNVMAVLGKARVHFSTGKYSEALKAYQYVLEHAPDMSDPDPRIGIGCCFWALGHHEDAKLAWSRALEINPKSKIAHVLLGIQTLEQTSKLPTSDPKFSSLYKTAMVQYAQEAFKLDNKFPLTCSVFGNYFLVRKGFNQVETLAKRAVELTDVSAIASDGWYLLARKEHYAGESAKAGDYYARADQARGGDQKGYGPAKFGNVQMRILQGDIDGAKFRLEKIVQQTKNIEAMTLLGTLWAEDAFTGRVGNTKEEIIGAQRKAIPLLESVRQAWKDPKRHAQQDSSVLLTLARLYEADSPDKALQCLQQVEQIELEYIPEDAIPNDAIDEESRLAAMREHLHPQLLNNVACFHYQADRFPEAVHLFQIALTGCTKLNRSDSEDSSDSEKTFALVASISFNLGRAYEAEGNLDQARQVYEGLLKQHPGYLDARMRLVNIALRQSPTDQGPKLMHELYEAESQNLDVRSLYGWYLRKAKKRVPDPAQDQEQRHYKHTLQNMDKHDRYSLTAMGNMYLTVAREMRRETEQDRTRRSKMYERSVEFFEKSLQLDPRNAYAAMGIGIAMVEDKKDFATGLQIFSKCRETVRDASVFLNLGHAYCEVKQYARAIEAYELALSKSSSGPTASPDPQTLACLGRAWLLRGKSERSLPSLKSSLDYSRQALLAAPTQIHFQFNVAFVQIQAAQLLNTLSDSQRSVEDIDEASKGLDEAIESFEQMSKAKDPPFSRTELEQRASMGRNTMKRQLDRAMASQREYEGKNRERLALARKAREEEIAAREAAQKKVDEEREAERRKIREEREEMARRDREVVERRLEEDRRVKEREAERAREREEGSVEVEDGVERPKKKKGGKRKKKAAVEGESEVDGVTTRDGSVDAEERPRSKKKRKLERKEVKSASSSKFKSSEFIVDDDEDVEQAPDTTTGEVTPALEASDGEETPMDQGDDQPEPDTVTSAAPRKKAARVIDEDDDEDESAPVPAPAPGPAAADDGDVMQDGE